MLEVESLEIVHQAVLKDLGSCDILVNGAGGNNPRATTDNEYQHEAKEGGKSFFDLDQTARSCSKGDFAMRGFIIGSVTSLG